MPIARPRPMSRARSRDAAGRRWTRIEMKMTLSMPEHDLEHREREQGDPGLGVRQQFHAIEDTGRDRIDAAYHGAAVTDLRARDRPLPVLDVLDVAPPTGPTAPRSPGRPARRPTGRVPARPADPAAVPCLDAGLPDEPERLGGDGRAAAGGGLRGGAVDGRRPTSSSSTPAPSARAPSRRSSGGRASLRGSRTANPGLRVVLTGCSVREPDRAGPAPTLSGGGRLPAARRGARARRSAGARVRAGADRRRGTAPRSAVGRARRRRSGGPSSVSPTAWPRRAPRAVGEGTVARALGDQRLAADHLRLRQDLHLLHRAVQPRPGAQPPVRRHRGRGARPGGGRLPRGHAAGPERQLLRPRPAARGAVRPRRRRALGRPPAGPRTVARTSPSSSARSTACARPTADPRSAGCGSSRRTRGTCPTA